MSRFQEPEVRLERQPHRHAVVRLRQVYHQLWQSQQQAVAVKVELEENPNPTQVQEVSR